MHANLGWAPDIANSKDIIYIFNVGDAPYVLRLVDDKHYLFIGECYIYGIMYGEVMNQGLVEQKFKISNKLHLGIGTKRLSRYE